MNFFPPNNFDGSESADSANCAPVSSRSTWVSVATNTALGCAQIIGGALFGSQALIADGFHSLSDLVSDCVVLFAGHHSKQDADEGHPYGHHRFETAASLVIGILLLAVGIGMLYAAVSKLIDPASIGPVVEAALWVALATIVAKEMLFRYMLAAAKEAKSSMLVANAWHARSDAASSLIVAVGIGGNLLGYAILDTVAALVVGLIVAKMGWGFSWEALHDLVDRAAEETEVQAIRTTLAGIQGVKGLHALRTRKMGDMIEVDVHLEVDGTITVAEGHAIAEAAREQVIRRHPVLNLMTHIDPVHH